MKKKTYSSLENALRILDLFTMEKSEYSIREISDQLGIAYSTAHRLVKNLEDEGFIVKDSILNSYRLSVSILSLSSVVTAHTKLISNSIYLLKKLSSQFKATVQIGVMHREHVYYINKTDYEHLIMGYVTYIERKVPLHYTSAGKILLSQLSEEEIINYSEQYLLTATAFSNIEDFLVELKHVKTNGYAISADEYYHDFITVAAPLKNTSGHIIAAIELVYPNDAKLLRTIEQRAKEFKQVCEKIRLNS